MTASSSSQAQRDSYRCVCVCVFTCVCVLSIEFSVMNTLREFVDLIDLMHYGLNFLHY